MEIHFFEKGTSAPFRLYSPGRFLKIVCACLVVLMLGTCISLLPALSGRQRAEAAKVKTVLEVIHLGFVIYELCAFGGETAKEALVPDPAEQILEEVEKQGVLIDEVQAGLDEIQQQLADMFQQLNLYDSMASAWNQIPNIQTFYNKLNREIADAPQGSVSKDLMDEWAHDVVDGNNIGDAVAQFYTALVKGGTAADQTPVLYQMRDMALQELSGVGAGSDFSTTVESTNGVGIVAERPMYFDYANMWNGGSCQAGVTSPASTFYFAEGTVRPGFHSYICVQNPTGKVAPVTITYMKGDGATSNQNMFVQPYARATANVNDFFGAVDGAPADFSAKVVSTSGSPIVAERPMYFDFDGSWDGGHVNAGVTQPATSLYFAEGTARPGFESFFCIQNPEDREAAVSIDYMRGNGSNQRQDLLVGPHSRTTVRASDFLGRVDDAAADFSARVDSTNGVGIVVERPMYFSYKGAWTGGHCQSGATAPAPAQYFAEGTTRPNFDPYICIQNPADAATPVEITYMLGTGANKTQQVNIPPRTRATVKVSDVLGQADNPSCDFSAKVASTNGAPILAERPMYFNYKGVWNGGHDEAGMSSPAGKFYFAEGTVRPGFDTYMCIQNPESRGANVRVTFMKGTGRTQVQDVYVPPKTRYTMRVGDTYTGTTLTDAYERYLEGFFEQCLYYQVIGAITQANALDYLYPNDPVSGSANWLNNRYLKTYMQEETDLFWKCVEQLVMSQADANQYGWGTTTDYLKLPGSSGEVADIFSRADLLRKTAMGQIRLPDTGTVVNGGICGHLIAAQDAVPAGQVPALKLQSGTTQYSSQWSEQGNTEWISTTGTSMKYDTWAPASGTDKTVGICGNWSTPRYDFRPSTAFADGSYTVLSPTGANLGTAVVSKTAFPDPRNSSSTLYLSYGSFLSQLRNKRLPCDPTQWATSSTVTDSCNPDPTMTFTQTLASGIQGIFMKISNANGDQYTKVLNFESNNFSSPVDLNIKIGTQVNLATASSSGQQKSSYGYVFGDIDWYTDDAQAKTHYQVFLKDMTANTVQNTVVEETISVNTTSGNYNMSSSFGHSSKSGTISCTLKANHKYHLIFKLDGWILGDEGGAVGGGGGDAEVNQKATIATLGVMAP